MFKNLFTYIKDNELKIIVLKNKISINNYKEIIDFDDNKISINCNDFTLVIIGNKLVINRLFDKEILIIGNIKEMDFINND